MKLTPEQLEALIVQAVDGTLSEIERAVLDEHLASDAEARLLLAEHQQLAAALRGLPGADFASVDFGAMSQRISSAIDQEPAYAAAPLKLTGPSGFVVWTRRLSIAAAVALVASVGYLAIPKAHNPAGPANMAGTEAAPAAVANAEKKDEPAIVKDPIKAPKLEITVASTETPKKQLGLIVVGPVTVQTGAGAKLDVAVGPTAEMAERGMTFGMGDDAFGAPAPKVSIGTGKPPTTAPAEGERLY